jgi:ribonucleoside-diphosphate reductase alpha chain
MWLAGEYPRALDGLCKLLSLDMRVIDPAWIGMKLRKLLDFPEPLGDFMAFVPGQKKQQTWPSTVSYVARLVLHRYAMLGLLDEEGASRRPGVLEQKTVRQKQLAGAKCPECASHTLIRKDGCDYCTTCGYVGVCG